MDAMRVTEWQALRGQRRAGEEGGKKKEQLSMVQDATPNK